MFTCVYTYGSTRTSVAYARTSIDIDIYIYIYIHNGVCVPQMADMVSLTARTQQACLSLASTDLQLVASKRQITELLHTREELNKLLTTESAHSAQLSVEAEKVHVENEELRSRMLSVNKQLNDAQEQLEHTRERVA